MKSTHYGLAIRKNVEKRYGLTSSVSPLLSNHKTYGILAHNRELVSKVYPVTLPSFSKRRAIENSSNTAKRKIREIDVTLSDPTVGQKQSIEFEGTVNKVEITNSYNQMHNVLGESELLTNKIENKINVSLDEGHNSSKQIHYLISEDSLYDELVLKDKIRDSLINNKINNSDYIKTHDTNDLKIFRGKQVANPIETNEQILNKSDLRLNEWDVHSLNSINIYYRKIKELQAYIYEVEGSDVPLFMVQEHILDLGKRKQLTQISKESLYVEYSVRAVEVKAESNNECISLAAHQHKPVDVAIDLMSESNQSIEQQEVLIQDSIEGIHKRPEIALKSIEFVANANIANDVIKSNLTKFETTDKQILVNTYSINHLEEGNYQNRYYTASTLKQEALTRNNEVKTIIKLSLDAERQSRTFESNESRFIGVSSEKSFETNLNEINLSITNKQIDVDINNLEQSELIEKYNDVENIEIGSGKMALRSVEESRLDSFTIKQVIYNGTITEECYGTNNRLISIYTNHIEQLSRKYLSYSGLLKSEQLILNKQSISGEITNYNKTDLNKTITSIHLTSQTANGKENLYLTVLDSSNEARNEPETVANLLNEDVVQRLAIEESDVLQPNLMIKQPKTGLLDTHTVMNKTIKPIILDTHSEMIKTEKPVILENHTEAYKTLKLAILEDLKQLFKRSIVEETLLNKIEDSKPQDPKIKKRIWLIPARGNHWNNWSGWKKTR